MAAANIAVDSQHRYGYDGLGRQTTDSLYSLNALKWTTTNSYGGDRVTVDQPVGGTDTTTVFDARGRQTALWQYQAATPSGAHDDSGYAYDDADQLKTVIP